MSECDSVRALWVVALDSSSPSAFSSLYTIMLVFPSRHGSGSACWVVWPLRLYLGGFVVVSGVCDPDYVRCVSVSDLVGLISLYRVGHCASLTMSACGAVWGCVYFASLLWGWTVCGPVRTGLCACVLVSFRSAFCISLGGGGEDEQEMELQVEEAARGRGEGFHILFQIMMYSEASVGLDGQTEPDRRLLCPEASLCLGV